jgi:CRP-like cAMP-binding protein
MEETLFAFISKYVPLTGAEKKALASQLLFRNVEKGTILLKQGRLSNDSYLVLKGCLRVYYLIDNEEKTTTFYTEFEGLIPNCVIFKAPSEYFISCVEDSVITVINNETCDEIFSKFPKFETFCRILSEEMLAKQQINLDSFKILSPEKRYLELLEKKPELIQRIPQNQLASYLGITAQSFSRLKTRMLEKNKS